MDRLKGQWRYFVSEKVEIIPPTGASEATKIAGCLPGSDLTLFQWLLAVAIYLLNGKSPFFHSQVEHLDGSTTLLLLTEDVLCLAVIKSSHAHREPSALILQFQISRAFGYGSINFGLNTTYNKMMQVQSPMLQMAFVHFIKTEENKSGSKYFTEL